MKNNIAAGLLMTAFIATGSAQSREPQDAKSATASGPKVHVSKSKDITGCSNTSGGIQSAAGIGLGALVGKKVGGGSMGIIAGGAVGNVVGDEIGRRERCGPGADIESNAAPDGDSKKKKSGLKSIIGF